MLCLAIVIAVAAVLLSYYYYFKPFSYWTKRGVKQLRPWPVLGDNYKLIFQQQSFGEFIKYLYDFNAGTRYTGLYLFSKPNLIIKDIDLIKQITVKDFDHFTDHQKFLPEDVDPYWAKNLFALKGQKWRNMRSTLSPAFTGSKMKQMFVLIQEIAEQFTRHFLNQDKDSFEIEMKDTLSRFTNDVIGSTAFGVQCDSLKDRTNEFYLMGKEASDMASLKKNLQLLCYIMLPKIAIFFGFKMLPKVVTDFFHNLMTTNMKEREERGIVRPDMVHLLMEARKNKLKHDEAIHEHDAGFATVQESDVGRDTKHRVELSDVDITAQGLIFFLAGFDSVSSIMCFMSHELGINSDVQERLRQEINEVHKDTRGKLTYEALMGMKYMDMVVSEVLRKWPAVLLLERLCTKPYTIQPTTPEEKPVEVEVDTLLGLPVFAIQRDPEHFPDPEKFDPERFNDENKSNIKPYSYFPFGLGPRACIGNRLALLEIKVLYFNLLRNFEIVPIAKTEIPLKMSKKALNANVPANGFWLGLKRLEN